jgi:hypothetical protein
MILEVLIKQVSLPRGITRAEQQVVLVGDPSVFRAAVAKPPAAELRTTGLLWPQPRKTPAAPGILLD